MPDYPRIELKYFDCRGRAQFLRGYLLHRGIPFEDDRVSMAGGFDTWQAMRADRTATGPFQKLPVLRWGDRRIAETTVIAAFVHRASGDAGLLSQEENLRHEMLISSTYIDLMMSMGILLWSELMFAGADFGATSKRMLDRVHAHLATIDPALGEWRWLERAADRPVMVADCILWDQLDSARHVFGDALRLDSTPTVARFYRDFAGRTTFERLLTEKPCQVTGRPGEAAAVARVRELVAAA
ncbi:MAG TPA: glutathione S-transferase N-terminal domain-containing protein [Gammaproteobacteria bacterium]|nr:glutathione S-transferase N-terminal domain-containing protein [Gammaproteobacteria bacterium]